MPKTLNGAKTQMIHSGVYLANVKADFLLLYWQATKCQLLLLTKCDKYTRSSEKSEIAF